MSRALLILAFAAAGACTLESTNPENFDSAQFRVGEDGTVQLGESAVVITPAGCTVGQVAVLTDSGWDCGHAVAVGSGLNTAGVGQQTISVDGGRVPITDGMCMNGEYVERTMGGWGCSTPAGTGAAGFSAPDMSGHSNYMGNGNVGIGQPLPAEKLDVNGNIRLAAGGHVSAEGDWSLSNTGLAIAEIQTDAMMLFGSLFFDSNVDVALGLVPATFDTPTATLAVHGQNAFGGASMPNEDGGDVCVYGGTPVGSGGEGNVVLAHAEGTGPVGKVLVRTDDDTLCAGTSDVCVNGDVEATGTVIAPGVPRNCAWVSNSGNMAGASVLCSMGTGGAKVVGGGCWHSSGPGLRFSNPNPSFDGWNCEAISSGGANLEAYAFCCDY